MTTAELTVLGWGLLLIMAYGAIHVGGLGAIRRLKPSQEDHRYLGLLATFWGLALLHLLEIAIGALVLALVLSGEGTGSLSEGFGSTAADFLYLAGTSFGTLGYTQLDATGPIRLLIMVLSLSGFMLITWSATFIYTIWGESFRE